MSYQRNDNESFFFFRGRSLRIRALRSDEHLFLACWRVVILWTDWNKISCLPKSISAVFLQTLAQKKQEKRNRATTRCKLSSLMMKYSSLSLHCFDSVSSLQSKVYAVLSLRSFFVASFLERNLPSAIVAGSGLKEQRCTNEGASLFCTIFTFSNFKAY